MLGCFKQVYPELEGVDLATPHKNDDGQGNSFGQQPTTERMMFLDPHHEVGHVKTQLADHNSGFVRDFAESFPESTFLARQFIMGYYPLDFLPALHALGRDFTICDHWFSSLPGPTWPNRFFALTGTSNGRVNMPDDGTHKADIRGYFQQTQTTLFDRLNERAIHWKVYFHDIPQTTVLVNQRMPHNAARYFYIDEFFADARGSEQEFPQFSLVEPDYMGVEQSDDHPPHDIMRAEKLIADVYNALRGNEELWSSTLLVVFYDEHGGFYDHVQPPKADPPDGHNEEYTFDQLGVRVPAILASPWVERGVEPTQFDHTSVLKYLIDKWQLGPLGKRAEGATSIAVALRQNQRTDTIPRIQMTPEQLIPPDIDAEEKAVGYVSPHQTALQKLAQHLEEEAFEKIPSAYAAGARVVEAIKGLAERWLAGLYQESSVLKVSIAEPDKLALSKDATPRDQVAQFFMRSKKYAVMGLADRLRDATLPIEQRLHSVQTLSIVTGRKFNAEADERLTRADTWLRDRGQ